MDYFLFSRFIACLVFILPGVYAFSTEENFFLINGETSEVLVELGPHTNERVTPCSSFKIALSLLAFDAGILKDEGTPTWDFQDGYDDFLEAWKSPQTPQSWMKYSCVWYSKVIALHLGLDNIQSYLSLLHYGNQDMSAGMVKPGPTNPAWINSSIKISPKEQVDFIQKMIHGRFPISSYAVQKTKALLFKEELPGGWSLFGKTGWSGSMSGENANALEVGWFVGWIEKDHQSYLFAYLIRAKKINLDQRVPRVKQLLLESSIMI